MKMSKAAMALCIIILAADVVVGLVLWTGLTLTGAGTPAEVFSALVWPLFAVLGFALVICVPFALTGSWILSKFMD